MESFKKYTAEMVGTCVLVMFGCGTACLVGTGTGAGYILTALSFGLAYLAMRYCIGNISGCHLNPALSLSMLLMRRMGIVECIGYMASQYIGGIAGSALLYLIFRYSPLEDVTGNLAANTIAGTGGNIWVAVLIETILTFAFVLTVIGATSRSENRGVSGVVCGLALCLVHIFGIGFTVTSVNPARSLGPALLVRGEALSQLWIFFVAPIIGAILAATLSIFFEREPKKKFHEQAGTSV